MTGAAVACNRASKATSNCQMAIRRELSETQVKLAAAEGFGWPTTETAQFAGISYDTAREYNKLPTVRAIASAVAACKSIDSTRHLTAHLEHAKAKAEDRIQSFFDRSFRLSEKALAHAEKLISDAEAEGKETDLKLLLALHKDFTQWAAKFSASEAPKRVEVGGEVEHRHVISLEEAKQLIRADQEMRAITQGNVIDVSPSN